MRAPCLLALALVPLAAVSLAPAPAGADSGTGDLVLVLDASGSMWGQIGGENKIVIARRVLRGLAEKLPDDAAVGLVAYGHRREGDCEDVETLAPVAPLDRDALLARVDALNPKGKTPITTALGHALGLVRDRPGAATVVLVSDGLETCGGDPCALVREAKERGAKIVLHVVGFDVGEEDVGQLECAAQAGGGLYFDARDADALSDALDRAVAATPEQPTGRLVIAAHADGAPTDALVRVFPAGGDEEVAAGRTYTGAETNPRIFFLADGRYDVEVTSISIRSRPSRRFEAVEVRAGASAERRADFSSGVIAVKVSRNGAISPSPARPRSSTPKLSTPSTARSSTRGIPTGRGALSPSPKTTRRGARPAAASPAGPPAHDE